MTNGQMPVIVASRREFIAVLDNFVFCNLCEKEETAFTSMYYIPILNQVYCEDCMRLYSESAVKYRVDDKTAEFFYNQMESKLKDLGVWEE